MSKSIRWVLQPTVPFPGRVVRRLVARGLRQAGALLARLSRRLSGAAIPAEQDSVFFEFHAEAGAPEGALYIDGVRVGSLPGVTRL
jgi:hypothetical protein